jgi:hypothetical protein
VLSEAARESGAAFFFARGITQLSGVIYCDAMNNGPGKKYAITSLFP